MRRSAPLRKASASRLNGRSAFTLVEMLIAVTVLAILASVALTSADSMRGQPLEAVARIVAADLRLARSLSIQYNTHYTVRFDTTSNSYELTGDPPPPSNPLASAAENEKGYRVELGRIGAPSGGSNGIRLERISLEKTESDEVSDVTFGPRGGTGPERIEDTRIEFTRGSGRSARSIALTVSWTTGQVWIEK